jgi:spore coat protein U-like protein
MAKYISRAAIAAAALALGVSGAYAGQYGTSELRVSVTVANSCRITNISPIVFTQIDGGGPTTQDKKASNIEVSCNGGTWNLSPTEDVPGDVRSMTHTNGVASLHYKLCKDESATYDTCTPFKQGAPISGSALNDTKTIYGVMEGDVLPVQSGTYSDVVIIQLTS